MSVTGHNEKLAAYLSRNVNYVRLDYRFPEILLSDDVNYVRHWNGTAIKPLFFLKKRLY
jgi:hypothetical protein